MNVAVVVGLLVAGVGMFASLLSWLQTGLGLVAVMAAAAIVIASVSLVISGNTARSLKALNKPADPTPDE